MSDQSPAIIVRLKVEPPITVDGGVTVWTIERDFYGKNASRLAVVARCVDTGQVITLIDGRARETQSSLMVHGILVRPETTSYKIFRKLIHEGKAEQVKR